MLVCNVSLRAPRRTIAADLAEVATADDAATTGQVVFATLVDDPVAVTDTVDAYLGEIMLEAVSAADTVDGAVPGVVTAAVAETATADSIQDGSSAPAVPPSFGSVSSIVGNLASTSGSPNQPSGIAAGDLCIAEIQVLGVNTTIGMTGTGWTLGDQTGAGSSCSAWAWRIGTATSNTSPTFSWSGAAAYHTKMIRYTGNHTTSPIGAIAKNAATSTAFSVSGITTTHAASMVFGFMSVAGNQVISTPSGFTSRSSFNDAFGSDNLVDQTVTTSGSSSNNLNATLSPSADWQGYLIEIKSP